MEGLVLMVVGVTLVYLYFISAGFQEVLPPKAAHSFPHRRAALRLLPVQQNLRQPGQPQHPPEDARGREDVPVWRLSDDVHHGRKCQEAHGRTPGQQIIILFLISDANH